MAWRGVIEILIFSTYFPLPLYINNSWSATNKVVLDLQNYKTNQKNRPYHSFDASLMGRQSDQKLQFLYGNPIANNFLQN